MTKTISINFIFFALLLCSLGATAQDKVMLCTGKSSHSYHKKTCTGLKQCRATIITTTLKDAIELGKDPCDFCYGHNAGDPKVSANAPARLYSNPKPTATRSTQCQAITKKGSQCSRAATSNGYCWQHD